MTKLTYNEYIKQLNREGLVKMLSNMTEVPDLDAAKQASESLMSDLVDSSGLTKAKIRKAKYTLAQIKFKESNYLAFLYDINGAQVMLRATNLDTKKYYIPNEVWIVVTNRETNESELVLGMSLSMEGHEPV